MMLKVLRGKSSFPLARTLNHKHLNRCFQRKYSRDKEIKKFKLMLKGDAPKPEETQTLQFSTNEGEDIEAKLLQNCSGCGIPIQTEDPKKLGFVPSDRINKFQSNESPFESLGDLSSLLPKIEKNLTCQRCWNLLHYGKVIPVEVTADVIKANLNHIKKSHSLIVKVVDIFDFDGSFIPNFISLAGNNPILLVANKCDILPKGASFSRLTHWLRREGNKRSVKFVDVLFVSSFTGEGISDVAQKIEYHRRGHDVYVMGQSNVGKSTFINQLLKQFSGGKQKPKFLTTSPVPGTTLSCIGFPIGTNSKLFDTPGVMKEDGIHRALSVEEFSILQPKKKIKPVVFRIPPGTSLFIGGIGRLDYIEGPPLVYFTIFTANEIYLHKSFTEKADELYKNQVGSLLTPPLSKTLQEHQILTPRPAVSYTSELGWREAFVDIVYHGIGWISVTGKGNIKVRAWAPPKVMVSDRQPLMPFESQLGKKPNPRKHMKVKGEEIILPEL
eukprot:TRINITY_DN5696_c0_g1_i1.p1 TRINITY_DN5696_c0_g1~~TRINITY_DN5696_c0_g1_i1.p1  ORF type:complete len:498 (-),score=136.94 TRINITY_DN5696_c0_g1_i1:95-1588(-)